MSVITSEHSTKIIESAPVLTASIDTAMSNERNSLAHNSAVYAIRVLVRTPAIVTSGDVEEEKVARNIISNGNS